MLLQRQVETGSGTMADGTGLQSPVIRSLEGTIQRVNYQRREVSIIAAGQPYHFSLTAETQLWFDGRLAPFRCFQPLDHVRAYYKADNSRLIAEALYAWAAEGANQPGPR
jgi:hypothetical protein